MKPSYLLALTSLCTVQGLMHNVVDVMMGEPDLSTLVAALTSAGLASGVNASNSVTVFPPTNDAFAAVDPAVLTQLMQPEWTLHLQNVLLYHTAGVEALSESLVDGMVVPMLDRENLTVSLGTNLSLLGEDFGSATVTEADIMAANGVVHKIDTVMLPSFAFSTLVDVAAGAPELRDFYNLVALAGLAEMLSTGNYTIFAPTNDAFHGLMGNTIAYLTDPANVQTLREVLLNHVVRGVVPSSTLTNEMMVTMVQGGQVQVGFTANGTITLDDVLSCPDAAIKMPDVLANNGLVHVIDRVLLLKPTWYDPNIQTGGYCVVQEGAIIVVPGDGDGGSSGGSSGKKSKSAMGGMRDRKTRGRDRMRIRGRQ